MTDFSEKLSELREQVEKEGRRKEREKKSKKFLTKQSVMHPIKKKFGIGPDKTEGRVQTGIPGFDDALHGGIPPGNLVVVAGGPGSGKTTLGLQFLYEGAKNHGENGVFVSLEEEPKRLIDNAERMGINLEELVEQGKILIIKSELFQLDELFRRVKSAVREVSAERLVIDPGSLLRLFFETEVEVRKAFVELASLLKRLEITSMITIDFHIEGKGVFEMEEYAADGVILLYHMKTGNIYQRMIAILKMRGTSHSEKVHPFKIGEGGLVVYPEEEVFREME